MQELSAEEFTNIQYDLLPLVLEAAAALPNLLGIGFSTEEPTVTLEVAAALAAEGSETLLTTFAMPAVCVDEVAVMLSQPDAAALAITLSGGIDDGITTYGEIQPEQVVALSPILEEVVSALVDAIAARAGVFGDSTQCRTAMSPVMLPPAFAIAREAVCARIPVRLPSSRVIMLGVLFTPDFARAICHGADSALAADLQQQSAKPALRTVEGGAADPFQAFGGFAGAGGGTRGIELILDVPLDVTVELGRVRMLIKDVLDLSPGSIVELDRVAGEPVDLMVNGRLVAKGEVVVIEDNFGIRITEIISPADRLSGVAARA